MRLRRLIMMCSNDYNVSFNTVGIEHEDYLKVPHDGLFLFPLVGESGKQVLPPTVKVTMGGVDVTDTAFNASNSTISIASVTGNIEITAIASAIITFEDSAVKAICVENWGGGITDEITEYEAALATSLGDNFKNNTTITKFNELRYFTGIDTLYTQFNGCTHLTELTFPEAYLNSSTNVNSRFASAFTGTKLVTCDLSPLTTTTARQSLIMGFANCTTIKEIIFPALSVNTMYYAFQACTNLEKVDFTLCDFADVPSSVNNRGTLTAAFYQTTKLSTIIGGFPNLKRSIGLNYCPLTVESAIAVVTSLSSSPVSGATLTLKSSLRTTYQANSDFNDAVSAAVANGWAIAYS